jgi:mevalonate kinase
MSAADIAFGYASGKIILAGEHAVVYGHPAIAAVLDRGVRIAVTDRASDSLGNGPVLRAAGLGFVGLVRPDPAGEGPDVLRRALERLAQLCGERVRQLEFIADSAIPGGRGLGSSAALSVAMVRGVYRFFDEAISPESVAELALELEKIFHGNPSGIDHTVISRGGLIWYQKQESRPNIEPIESKRPMRFAVGLAGPHAGTMQAVQALRHRAKRHEAAYKHIFDGIANLVCEMRLAIQEGRLAAVGELMNLNQGYLNALAVSTPELEAL